MAAGLATETMIFSITKALHHWIERGRGNLPEEGVV